MEVAVNLRARWAYLRLDMNPRPPSILTAAFTPQGQAFSLWIDLVGDQSSCSINRKFSALMPFYQLGSKLEGSSKKI